MGVFSPVASTDLSHRLAALSKTYPANVSTERFVTEDGSLHTRVCVSDILDPALLRPGRLDRKIEIPLPNETSRLDIIKIHSAPITKRGEIDFESVVKVRHMVPLSHALWLLAAGGRLVTSACAARLVSQGKANCYPERLCSLSLSLLFRSAPFLTDAKQSTNPVFTKSNQTTALFPICCA